MTEKEKNLIKNKLRIVLKKHGVQKAGIFGSFARGEANKNSDIDILVKFKGQRSLFDLSGLMITLEDVLGKKVDVLTYDSLNPLIKEAILKDEEKII